MIRNRDNATIAPAPEAPESEPRADKHSFDTFIRSQFHHLVQFLRSRTASEQDAEDAAQESLTKLLRYRDTEPASAWKQLLYRIALNTAHDQYRNAVIRHSFDHVAIEELDIVAPEHSPEQGAIFDQEVMRISIAIESLPPKCQRVYILKRVYGLSRVEIAERCGISVKMVEKHLATALARLKSMVGNSSTDTL
ncbi:DNA-directed RNA polymerase sigma-70 factor [Dyella acidisoli]|uniref:DNA-directed RNA polymerase sigma-70 factor n=2 Tax=Dyella acidisoli TaxID=1867834 RepID=A0ABQ5XQU3_9GAMM|nr:DNA-directed RNA polymerase sigma-70 factor [Dyella acidisoli]